jgi:hypothetical protein
MSHFDTKPDYITSYTREIRGDIKYLNVALHDCFHACDFALVRLNALRPTIIDELTIDELVEKDKNWKKLTSKMRAAMAEVRKLQDEILLYDINAQLAKEAELRKGGRQ